MDNWNEIRTAYHVVKLGTVSAAADALGVHRATVIRHIDALEQVMGVKLFQRHARGYTPTEAGQDLLRVAKATDDQFAQLLGRNKNKDQTLTGDLIITSLEEVATYVMPAILAFQVAHPAITVRFLVSDRLFKLEYGEAHIAIRAGNRPDEPDNVVQPYHGIDVALYASESYLAKHGHPKTFDDLHTHRFIGSEMANSPAPYNVWMREHIPQENIIFRTTSNVANAAAICTGIGIGFMSKHSAATRSNLVELFAPRKEWSGPLWLVTHVDLHRSAKIQAFLDILKSYQPNAD